jgi:hypothetical protein
MAGTAPYGFTYLRGRPVVHPGEVEQLLLILELFVSSIIERREKHNELLAEFLQPRQIRKQGEIYGVG